MVTRKKSTPNSRKRTTSKKRVSRSRKAPPNIFQKFLAGIGESLHNITLDQRLDFIGILLILLGMLSLLGFIFVDSTNLFSAWSLFLQRIVGWAAYILTFIFIIFGLWLVLRRFERIPSLTPERITGIFLLYLNILTWFHFAAMTFLASIETGQGGGVLGGFFAIPLVNWLGFPAAILFAIFMLWCGLVLAFDLPFVRIWSWIQPSINVLEEKFNTRRENRLAQERLSTKDEIDIPDDLPAVFKPITEIGKSNGKPETTQEETPAKKKKTNTEPEDEFSNSINTPPPDQQWEHPKIEELLRPAPEFEEDFTQVEEQARIIEETLELLGAPGHVVEINHGPRVTQFGIEPDFNEKRGGDRVRVRVNKVVSLADDLTMALASQSVRIQAPVPGKNYIGIEVPNPKAQPVSLMEVIESQSFREIHSPLRFGLGKDVTGRSIAANLKTMPHLLIAGTTGSGKSVCINAILCNFLLYNSPRNLRLVLVDPKRVELTGYNGIPHLLAPVVVDMGKVVNALQWIMREMEARYHKFSKVGARNLVGYNLKRPEDYMPHIVIVIDELADLMMTAPGETEAAITRLAQLARATGIHLILATQRPSIKVITGLIKANFPARIAFNVATGVDSRVILDSNGAERLLGKGDMLFKPPDMATPSRLQGVYLSDKEIDAIVNYWRNASVKGSKGKQKKSSQKTRSRADSTLKQTTDLQQGNLWDIERKQDALLEEAIDVVRREERASTTMLQRRLRIGYTRAARMIDTLQNMGIIGAPHPTTQIRDVLDYGSPDSTSED